MAKITAGIRAESGPDVLVDSSFFDDGCVYRLDDAKAIVQTVDFFPPVVNDSYTFGAIAAANALSDIYAMGAKPLFALNIVSFPSSRIPMEVLSEILRGGKEKTEEAGIQILGGHTIDDIEPKYGLVVTGTVHPDRIVRNRGVSSGDVLILTKPLGTGIITTALKFNQCPSEVEKKAVQVMSSLNRTACEQMLTVDVTAATDVTGYGLVGHLFEMINNSKLSCRLYFEKLPVIEGVKELVEKGQVPGGTRRNLEYFGKFCDFNGLKEWQKIVVADAQTSGGLLIALPDCQADVLINKMKTEGLESSVIGIITEQRDSLIEFGR